MNSPLENREVRLRGLARAISLVGTVTKNMTVERHHGLLDQRVTYSVEYRGRVIIIENVPARVDPETGEQFFSPETVERVQEIVWSGREPDRVVETPVFQFAG